MASQWYSQDPRTPQAGFTPYPAADNAAIEQSYQAGKPTHALHINNMVFTVNFGDMKQYNQSGGSRPIRRGPPMAGGNGGGGFPTHTPVSFSSSAPRSVAATSVDPNSLRQQVATVLVTGGTPGEDRVGISGATLFLANTDIKKMDALCNDVVSKLHSFRHYLTPTGIFSNSPSTTVEDRLKSAKIESDVIVHLLNIIIDLFAIRGLTGDDDGDDASDLHGHTVGSPVPAYNANAKSESVYRRKYLSLLGLRNLAVQGPQIFSQLHYRLFSGNPGDYGSHDGPNRMRYVTGNVVDLDTVVLDCNRQLKEFGTSTNPNTFFASAEARNIAVAGAGPLIEVFIDQLKISKDVASKRNLTPLPTNGGSIPIASNNTDRGKWPLWGYANVGVLTYHANVPHLPDVVGALLKAPFHLAKAFVLLLTRNNMLENGTVRTDNASIDTFITAMREFFDEAVNDSCFNAKWKQIEAYSTRWRTATPFATFSMNCRERTSKYSMRPYSIRMMRLARTSVRQWRP